jgi:hypothetical protein
MCWYRRWYALKEKTALWGAEIFRDEYCCVLLLRVADAAGVRNLELPLLRNQFQLISVTHMIPAGRPNDPCARHTIDAETVPGNG